MQYNDCEPFTKDGIIDLLNAFRDLLTSNYFPAAWLYEYRLAEDNTVWWVLSCHAPHWRHRDLKAYSCLIKTSHSATRAGSCLIKTSRSAIRAGSWLIKTSHSAIRVGSCLIKTTVLKAYSSLTGNGEARGTTHSLSNMHGH